MNDRGFTRMGRARDAAPGSAPVTLLVLRPGSAPARIVPPDPLAAGREPRLRSAASRGRPDHVAGDWLVAERGAHRPAGRRRRPAATQDGRNTHPGRRPEPRL